MLRFTKMNGAGNDFILFDNRTGDIDLDRSQIAKLCDRHRGIGADGILLLENPTNRADFRMRYFNADGGEAEMCGNGARCFARFANKVGGQKTKLSFETPVGVISAELKGDLVTLRMTEPTDLRLNVVLPMAAENKTVHFINSGVPHVVIPVAKIDDADVRREGAAIRHHKMFSPNGTNVDFIEKRGPNKIAIRTYERGVEDETLACGTGIVASALIFAATENCEGPVTVLARGGDELQVSFEKVEERFPQRHTHRASRICFRGNYRDLNLATDGHRCSRIVSVARFLSDVSSAVNLWSRTICFAARSRHWSRHFAMAALTFLHSNN